MEGKYITPVAHIETDFVEKFGIPRQSGRVGSLVGRIVFEEKFRVKDALREIEGFTHLWLLFDFSATPTVEFSPTVRPPRLGGNRRVGVFASRSPFRPNGIGLSCVELLGIEHTKEQGDVLLVGGADLLNGTPIYDIKPYLPSADRKMDAKGGYADEFTSYSLKVECREELLAVLPKEKQAAFLDCLAEDPRPSYIENEDRVYGMAFAGVNATFQVKGDTLTVLTVCKKQEEER